MLSEAKKQVSEGLERQHSLEEDVKQQRAKVVEIEESQRKVESELKERLEECKVNVSRRVGVGPCWVGVAVRGAVGWVWPPQAVRGGCECPPHPGRGSVGRVRLSWCLSAAV